MKRLSIKEKSLLMAISIILLLSILLCSSTLASQSSVDKNRLGTELTVEILEDGSVAPVENTSELSEVHLDIILKRIGYTNNYIDKCDIMRKRRLVNVGGKVIDGQIFNFQHAQIASNEQIEAATSNMSQNGYLEDGKWSAFISSTKVGETDTHYKYLIAMDYFWDQQPIAQFSDNASLSWAGIGYLVSGTTVSKNEVYYKGNWMVFDNTVNSLSNSGMAVDIACTDFVYGPQTGFLECQIYVSKDFIGQEATISGAYNHPWSPGGFILKGDKWSWDYGFTVL
ncbi:MAG: hypothetical protein PWP30_1290 [Eubacteriaceae bacterium]|nr:hypothetical protein [Eubacteriaceae bacterium]